jgi:SAM-dependent methyltransferase
VKSCCRICGAEGTPEALLLHEMMYGTQETFAYEQCRACGSLQIQVIPPDLGRYYPPGYPSHQPPPRLRWFRRLALRLANQRKVLLHSDAHLIRLLVNGVLNKTFQVRVHPLAPLRGRLSSQELEFADVGGASGFLLADLKRSGFPHLTSIDPFFTGPTQPGVKFIGRELHTITSAFDVIMYHHTLEHVWDIPRELSAVRAHLKFGGFALLRLPVVPNAAFELYGKYWVQLDPPRHLHIPSRRGIEIAAARAGLDIVESGDDSTDFQFWVSELYSRGVALCEVEKAGGVTAFFSSRQLRTYRRAAMELNAARKGDQAWFILKVSA